VTFQLLLKTGHFVGGGKKPPQCYHTHTHTHTHHYIIIIYTKRRAGERESSKRLLLLLLHYWYLNNMNCKYINTYVKTLRRRHRGRSIGRRIRKRERNCDRPKFFVVYTMGTFITLSCIHNMHTYLRSLQLLIKKCIVCR